MLRVRAAADLAEALREAVRTGQLLDLAPDFADASLEASNGDAWPVNRHVPAVLLRSILLDPDLIPDPLGLQLRGALVTGALDLDQAELPCRLAVVQSRFTAPMTLENATIPSLILIGSYLPALSFASARVGGDVDLARLKAPGGVRANNARVDGQLILVDAEVANDDGPALDLQSARIGGSAFLTRLTTSGEVRALRAEITAQLGLEDAVLVNEGGPALSLDGARIGYAFMKKLNATGEVRALGSHVAGQLVLHEATLFNKGAHALGLDCARIDGGAVLQGLRATGVVSAGAARFVAQLDLQDATLVNTGATALNLERARVDGDAFLSRLRADGVIATLGAQITGKFVLENSILCNRGAVALHAQGMAVAVLDIRGVTTDGGLDLTGAQLGELVVGDALSAKGLPGPLNASGWSVQNVRGIISTDRTATRGWLDTAPAFVAQPWHELAQVYDRNGQPADATYLRLQAARRATQTSPWSSRPARVAYDLLVGYGYRPLLAGAWLIAALLTAFIITSTNRDAFEPSNSTQAQAALVAGTDPAPAAAGTPGGPGPTAARSGGGELRGTLPTGTTRCEDLAGYPCLRPGLYALETVLPPTVTTGQGTSWRPATARIAYTLTFLKAFGWLLTALLLAGVTGLLRKT